MFFFFSLLQLVALSQHMRKYHEKKIFDLKVDDDAVKLHDVFICIFPKKKPCTITFSRSYLGGDADTVFLHVHDGF